MIVEGHCTPTDACGLENENLRLNSSSKKPVLCTVGQGPSKETNRSQSTWLLGEKVHLAEDLLQIGRLAHSYWLDCMYGFIEWLGSALVGRGGYSISHENVW